MIKTTAINLPNPEKMMITWDTGRRCNYDCTYCEISRHDTYSSYHSYEELFETFEFIKEYTKIYNTAGQEVNIDFTGGEPTANPALWKLAKHISDNEPNFSCGLTTNGVWNPRRTEEILDLFHGLTVSYHPEGNEKSKAHVLENIKRLGESRIWLQVNVMMHVDYFEEVQGVCYLLKDLGIKHKPIPIGDGAIERSGWFKDTDGSMRRTSHSYSEEQQQWFFDYIGQPKPVKSKSEGSAVGRGCCGGRCMEGKVDNEWVPITHVDNHFKGWHCSVNRYFMHIDQHLKLVYHHQTCQALHGGKRGPLGSLTEPHKILEYARTAVSSGPIICPNDRCGCGMCVPKAKELNDYNSITALNI
jgi:MoaA/NifB/PqqE/SkfB family radical SAM enzyme